MVSALGVCFITGIYPACKEMLGKVRLK